MMTVLTHVKRFEMRIGEKGRAQWTHKTSNGMYQYFIKVVPTIYTDIRGHTVNSNQYSVTEHFKDLEFISSNSHPGVFFFYDFSPIKILTRKHLEKDDTTLVFIFPCNWSDKDCVTSRLGIFTVARIIDSRYLGLKRKKKSITLAFNTVFFEFSDGSDDNRACKWIDAAVYMPCNSLSNLKELRLPGVEPGLLLGRQLS
ncbi:polymerase/histidinol phosphatase-like [Hibiscus syriacus]|uniref:Polymerase/histidinol phosphatase-like n=1 Tax=Hibiscus syriacus TaxID=106335 RepID=A0A6A3CTI5_HIBSY|nr:polymerase/histidinol phosphatase-like [Hibiscus syriacus]